MELNYPINLVGYQEWLDSGFAVSRASGDVITSDGEVLGIWRVAYNPEAKPGVDDEGGCFEFIADGQSAPMFSAGFAILDSRINQGTALSYFTRTIRDWHEAGS
ncbi:MULTISPECIES: hypothetical protein [Roseovarius]|uniref:hypothetical protein n=1 Tax=Roseovarius TaxID=74030 RepID=UPI00273E08B1|nr:MULTISPECIES: hypothetical protein [unclassified Roseovarius]